MRRIVTGMWVSLCAGCVGEQAILSNRTATDVWQQAPTDEVDILWVVDNSNSMGAEQDLLSAGFSSFIEQIEDSGTNFHLGVITTSFEYSDPERGRLIGDPPVLTSAEDYRTLFEQRALVGLRGSGREKGLEAAAYALSPVMTTGPNAGFLRPDANLLVIFVSDEDDCSDEGALGATSDNRDCYSKRSQLVDVGEYVVRMQNLKPRLDRVQAAAIVGPPNAEAECKDTTIEGRRYIEMARLTGGLSASICQEDWSGILEELGLNAAGIFTVFELSHGAAPDTLEVFVDGEPVPESAFDGYTYDPVAYSIEFHGVYIPARGSSITATYEILSGS